MNLPRYAVVGNPVSHSKSPLIHQLFATQTGITLEYTTIQAQEENFSDVVTHFFAQGGKGLNITVPFKEKACRLIQQCSKRADLAKAVNTLLINTEGKLYGDNTDGVGLVTDIKLNHNFDLAAKRILILGAGGAVRGVLSALVKESPTSITLMNRTASKALQLKEAFKAVFTINIASYDEASHQQYDLIINGTSLSLQGNLPPIQSTILAGDCCCYDMMYGKQDTVFIHWAKERGAGLALDGLGMLVEQAAESFYLWHGIKPVTSTVIKTVKTSM